MSIVNNGNATVNFDYKQPTTGSSFNRLLQGGIKPGIHTGGTLAKVTDTSITISPFIAYVNVGSDKIVRIQTTTNVTLAVTFATPVVYMTFDWSDSIENWPDFLSHADTGPVANEVRFGKIIFSGTTIIGFDQSNDYKDMSTFDTSYNMHVQQKLFAYTDPTTHDEVGNLHFNDDRYLLRTEDLNLPITDLRTRIEQQEDKIMEQEVELAYLEGRVASTSDAIIEPFFNKDFTDTDYENANQRNTVFVDDQNEWNDNWKYRDGERIDWKNGFGKPQTQKYMLEKVENFNLDGVGQINKCSIRYDSVNSCYWLLTNAGDNGIGQIIKLSSIMREETVQVLAMYYLPVPGSGSGYSWSGLGTDSTYIWVTVHGDGLTTSHVYGYKINGDGSLGESGAKAFNGQTLNLTTSCYADAPIGNSGNDIGYYTDVVNWDSTTVMCLVVKDATNVNLIRRDKNNLGSSVSDDITGLDKYIGGTTTYNRNIERNGNTAYIRVNDLTDNLRVIYSFSITNDVVSNVLINTTGRFDTSRDVDAITFSGEGLCIDKYSDLLEVSCTASYGKFITKRAITDALWAENQISGEHKCNASTNPNVPYASMVDPSGNFWTADTGVTGEQVDLYRFDPNGAKHSVRLTGATRAWTSLFDLTTDGTTVWMLGSDATNWEVISGSLLILNTAIELVSNYDATNVIDIDTWTVSASRAASDTEVLYGICYDDDSDVLLLLNDSTDKIDTLSTDIQTWTPAVYDLPAPIANWEGIAYKNSIIYIGDYTGGATPNYIYALNKSLSTGSAWYRRHIYQDSDRIFSAAGSSCFDFNGNDLVRINQTSLRFTSMKTLHDPDVIQLHSFMDANNVLLSSATWGMTAIAERYFNDVSDYADSADMPDKYYMCVGYKSNGFSELHLDVFLFNKSTTGQHRYYVEDIRTRHYIADTTASTPDNPHNIIVSTPSIKAIFIEKEMIFVGGDGGGSNNTELLMIDLKAGTAMIAYQNAGSVAYTGWYYNGTLTQRNAGLGYIGTVNLELVISGFSIYSFHARTFSKDDTSDYNYENKKTYITIGTNGGCDLLVIDWDDNNKRTPIKIWNNVGGETVLGAYASFIAPSGKVFMGEAPGGTNLYYGNVPVWQVSEDAAYAYGNTQKATVVGSSIQIAGALYISPNSPCWKTPSGTWRHILYISSDDDNAMVFKVDIENVKRENIIIPVSSTSVNSFSVDNFEDYIFCETSRTSGANDFNSAVILKKVYYDFIDAQNWYTVPLGNKTANGWNTVWASKGVASINRPVFGAGVTVGGAGDNVIKFSSEFGCFGITTQTQGVQLFHFINYITPSTHKSTVEDCTNPRAYHYKKSMQYNADAGNAYMAFDNLNSELVSGQLFTYYNMYSGSIYSYPVVENATTLLDKTQSFYVSASGTTVFTLSGNNRAHRFIEASDDNGVSWALPHDVDFEWGTNAPDYDNNLIGSDGYFTVKYDSAVPVGRTVLICYSPMVDKFYMEHTFVQPYSASGSTYTDKRSVVRLCDYSIELIKEY